MNLVVFPHNAAADVVSFILSLFVSLRCFFGASTAFNLRFFFLRQIMSVLLLRNMSLILPASGFSVVAICSHAMAWHALGQMSAMGEKHNDWSSSYPASFFFPQFDETVMKKTVEKTKQKQVGSRCFVSKTAGTNIHKAKLSSGNNVYWQQDEVHGALIS